MQMDYVMCKAADRVRTVGVHLSGIFSATRNVARMNTTPRSTWKSKIVAIYDAQGGKCALSGTDNVRV